MIHIIVINRRHAFAMLLLSACVIGFLFDGALMLIGALGFPDDAMLLTPVPLWMLMMWVNLAITIPFSLSWLQERYVLAAAFGFLGGPGAYFTGMKLGAVQLGTDLPQSLMLVGFEWAVAMPVLLLIATRVESGDRKASADLRSPEGLVS
jgi:hypothetical protein